MCRQSWSSSQRLVRDCSVLCGPLLTVLLRTYCMVVLVASGSVRLGHVFLPSPCPACARPDLREKFSILFFSFRARCDGLELTFGTECRREGNENANPSRSLGESRLIIFLGGRGRSEDSAVLSVFGGAETHRYFQGIYHREYIVLPTL